MFLRLALILPTAACVDDAGEKTFGRFVIVFGGTRLSDYSEPMVLSVGLV